MLDKGIIWLSMNAFSSLVLLVKKKDGTLRFCIDYWVLNRPTISNWFSIQTIDEIFDELHKNSIYTKLGLHSSYHQVRMAEKDIHKKKF